MFKTNLSRFIFNDHDRLFTNKLLRTIDFGTIAKLRNLFLKVELNRFNNQFRSNLSHGYPWDIPLLKYFSPPYSLFFRSYLLSEILYSKSNLLYQWQANTFKYHFTCLHIMVRAEEAVRIVSSAFDAFLNFCLRLN